MEPESDEYNDKKFEEEACKLVNSTLNSIKLSAEEVDTIQQSDLNHNQNFPQPIVDSDESRIITFSGPNFSEQNEEKDNIKFTETSKETKDLMTLDDQPNLTGGPVGWTIEDKCKNVIENHKDSDQHVSQLDSLPTPTVLMKTAEVTDAVDADKEFVEQTPEVAPESLLPTQLTLDEMSPSALPDPSEVIAAKVAPSTSPTPAEIIAAEAAGSISPPPSPAKHDEIPTHSSIPVKHSKVTLTNLFYCFC